MKRWMKWGLAALVVALLAAGLLRALSARKAQQQALAAQQAQRTQASVELAPGDVLAVQVRELTQTLPLSGAIKARDSAFVKARVAGELQGLTLREGDAVKAGQVIARIDPTESQARLRQAEQQAQAARAQEDIAQRQLDNNRALVAQGFISKTALDTSLNNLQAAQASLQAAQAAADVARKALDDSVLKSPISGWVAQRLAQPGERVAVDTRILEVVDLSRLELEASLGAAESVGVRVGQSAALQIEGVPEAVTAKVLRISPSTQTGSRGVLVYLGLEGHAGLRQGLFAQGTLDMGHSSGLAVPLDAVRTDKPTPYVQVVEQGQVVHREVVLGARGQADGQRMVLVQGLADNTQLLGGHLGPLRAGTAVRFTPATGATAGAR
jgi:RND family efflux transporter MFP subunit